jgi:hypothetical protein
MSVIGRAGVGIASVTVEWTGSPVVVATLQNGWFAAWWPAPLAGRNGRGPDFPAVRIRAFDALGDQVAEETLAQGM